MDEFTKIRNEQLLNSLSPRERYHYDTLMMHKGIDTLGDVKTPVNPKDIEMARFVAGHETQPIESTKQPISTESTKINDIDFLSNALSKHTNIPKEEISSYAKAINRNIEWDRPSASSYEGINELLDIMKKNNIKPEKIRLLEGGGSVLPQALIEMAMLEGGVKALSIPPLNEGEDEKMQQINALNKQKYLESLSRGPSSESDWYSAMDTMSSEAYKTNTKLFRPTYIGDESGYSYVSPQSSAADYNVIAPALQRVYGTPENYMIEGYKNLEQEAQNPIDYNPIASKKNKQKLLDQLYPQIKS